LSHVCRWFPQSSRKVKRRAHSRIKAVLRRARGMRDDQLLVLKLKWAPLIRSGTLAI
jgi:hypothetical protein